MKFTNHISRLTGWGMPWSLRYLVTGICLLTGVAAYGQNEPDTVKSRELEELTVTTRRPGMSRVAGAENGIRINRVELFRAACCNLGESFTTNPSVDVNYSDAATGAKQIRLLGLSGTYVQMLTENLPNWRGAASPYALDYVPGPWMNSIQVSKGASSVRNGYESITGQIDIEYLKPDNDPGLTVNLYGSSLGRFEANADGNVHLTQRLSSELLAHYQDEWGHHDMNHDGFQDQPNVRQVNLMNRWKWHGDSHLFHGGLGLINEKRNGGQTHHTAPDLHHLYGINIETERYEGYMKHAFFLNPEHGTNIALMGNLSSHSMDAAWGHKSYHVNQKNAYAQLMFETDFAVGHNLSAGLSLVHDYLKQDLQNCGFNAGKERETTTGVYAQYTYTLTDKVVAMAGLRVDHSSLHGTFLTPRFHLKVTPHEVVSLRFSAGKGYRTVHALAENNYLLASGRRLVIEPMGQEKAWNYGASGSLLIPIGGKMLKVNLEYYHTRFGNQAVVDYDTDATIIRIADLDGKSYSNTFQIDATYPIISGLVLTAAYRWNDVKTTYGGKLLEKPLTNRYKGLLTASYKTPLELWQFDITLQLNGGGRMPTPYTLPDGSPSWPSHFHAFEQLSAQVTRWFRHFSVYIGGENLTGVRQQQTIINAADPWSETFDPTMVWGPVHGAMAYAGIRINIGRL